MRGGRNMGRGRGRGGRQNNNMSSGSLVSEHLRDIDLELELLKRKRELIEQHSLYEPYKKQQQRNYTEPIYNNTYNDNVAQGSSKHDFSHLYDDEPQQNRNKFAIKRTYDDDWQQQLYPKKAARRCGYSGPSSDRIQRSYASTNRPIKSFANKPLQGKQSIGQRISNQKQQVPAQSFVPVKVEKPTKKPVPLNKIASQPIPERNRLVEATMKLVAEMEVPKKVEMKDEFRLLADKQPSKQMRGRMEMCLGAIMSNVKEVYADTPHSFALSRFPLQRLIKQNIRNRIRTALLGKIIGSPKEIIKQYRDMYPQETDQDIINEVIKIARLDEEDQSVNPRVLERKKIEDVSRPHDYYKDNMISLLTNHLYEMFDKVEENSKSDKNNVSTSEMDVDADKTNEVAGDIANTVATKIDNDTAKAGEAGGITSKDSVVKPTGELFKLELNPFTYKMMLPRIIRRHIPAILKMLNVNKVFRKAVDDLAATTRLKYVEYGKEREKISDTMKSAVTSHTEATQVVNSTVGMQKKTSLYPLPYYVKLMGKPHLPKRKVMQPFLEQFNPKSIKKHRTIHNLLFIGLTEKKDFDAIVAANGTVMGKSTFSIRICEKCNEKQENNSTVKVDDKDNSSIDISNQKYDEQKSSNDDITPTNLNKQTDVSQISKQIEVESEKHSNNSEQGNEKNILEVKNETPVNTNSETLPKAGKNECSEEIVGQPSNEKSDPMSQDANLASNSSQDVVVLDDTGVIVLDEQENSQDSDVITVEEKSV